MQSITVPAESTNENSNDSNYLASILPIVRARRKTFRPQVFSPAEVADLIRACSNRGKTGYRNKALLALLYRCGCRIREALDLMPHDIDMQTGAVRIMHGKGDRFRVIGIDSKALELLESWLIIRADLPAVSDRSPLFCTLKGGSMSTAYMRHLLPRLAERAKILKRVHCHGFRHTLAAELAAENAPLNIIQAQLGHANAATTSRYLAHIAPAQLIKTMQARVWNPPA